MGLEHSHTPVARSGTAAAKHKNRLRIALGLTATFMLVEVVGGVWTGSLALLADAAHMLTDVGGLVLALIAIWFSERPATPQKTYGYIRTEVLSALANAVVLLAVGAYVLFQAYERFLNPPEVLGAPMIVIAIIGLLVNLLSLRILSSGAKESLNVKGAYFEVLADMLGSLGVLLAAAIILLTGWPLADPIIGAGIGLFIVPRTWTLLKHAVHILMEGTPAEIDLSLLERALLGVPGALAVHDLHVWTISSGVDAMSCHLVVQDVVSTPRTLAAARKIMEEQFRITHVTIQVEDEPTRADEKENLF